MANNAAVFFLEADVQQLAGSLKESKVVLAWHKLDKGQYVTKLVQ